MTTLRKRVAVYARYSPKPKGAVGENYSIGSQLDAMREKALAEFGCDAPVEFIDRDVSAKNLDRPALDDLRDAVAAGLFDIVMAHSLDRLSREPADMLVLIKEFEKRGATLCFVNGTYDDSAEGELSLTVQSAVTKYERRKFAERSRRGRRRKAKEGFVHSGSVPLGYEYRGHQQGSRGEYVVIEKDAALVRRLFEATASGMTNYAVAKMLNTEGVKTPKGHLWFRESVRQVLRKTTYYGEVKGPAGIIIPVPAIVTRQLWERAHAAMRRNAIGKVGRPPREYLLTGHLWCGKCGARCTSMLSGTGKTSYRCRMVDTRTRIRSCAAPGVEKGRIEATVWNALCETLSNAERLWSAIEQYHKRVAATIKREARRSDAVAVRIEKARRALAHAERIFRDPDAPIPYEQAKAQLTAAKRELTEAESARPAADIVSMPARQAIAAVARTFMAIREVEDFKDRRGILERAVKKISYDAGEVAIECAVSLGSARAGNWNRRQYANCNFPELIPFVIRKRVA